MIPARLLAVCVSALIAGSAVAQTAPEPAPPPGARFIAKPKWKRLPSGGDIAGQVSRPTAGAKIGGAVVIECIVGAGGRLVDCKVLAERPEGQGFGEAGLRLTSKFVMAPRDKDGLPTEGGFVRIPLSFFPTH
ncbi:MAG TPA: hypothetical protein PLO65_13840 [Caulobacter sp.]|nr:hypothetical protein [Caulobacter sp.]